MHSLKFSHNANNQLKQEDLLNTVLVDILVLSYLVFNQVCEMNPSILILHARTLRHSEV